MTILLDHLIVPSRNPVTAALSLADILGVPLEQAVGHFTPEYLSGTLTLDKRDKFESHHYAFHVSETQFDDIFGRVQAAGIKYRSTPTGADDMELNPRLGDATSTGPMMTVTSGKC